MSSNNTIRGYVPEVIADIAATLVHHGFTDVDLDGIRQLVETHKDRFIDAQIGDLEQLRLLLYKQEDLEVIQTLLRAHDPREVAP